MSRQERNPQAPAPQAPKKSPPTKADPLYARAETGAPKDRRDGRAKVTGTAKFAAENSPEGVAYGVAVMSAIARGEVRSMDIRAAERVPGVLKVLTPFNVQKPGPMPTQEQNTGAVAARPVGPLASTAISHEGQYIGLVVAETLEAAEHAASLVRAEYAEEKPIGDWKKAKVEDPNNGIREREKDTIRGNPARAFSGAPVRVSETYSTPFENHNPIEPHATVAEFKDGKLTLWEASQNIYGVRATISETFGLDPQDVRVICPYIGGAFGCKGTLYPHAPLAVMGARETGRPVKIAITREQMFTEVGGRARTEQGVSLGADRRGDLKAVVHEGRSATATDKEFIEPFTKATHMLYDVENLRASQRVSKMSICVPTFMRSPGEASGMFALESAMDEMAWELGMDPMEFRILNEPPVNPETGDKWSSRSAVESFRTAAERFGWSKRAKTTRATREGHLLMGMGCAIATYPENRFPTSAKARYSKDGLVVQCATHEMGTGVATTQAQLAADFAGLPFERVRFECGDTALPFAPTSGGAATSASAGTANHAAVRSLQAKMVELLAANPASPLYGPQGLQAAGALKAAAAMGSDGAGNPKGQLPSLEAAKPMAVADFVIIGNGRIALKSDPSKFETYDSALARLGIEAIEADGRFTPPPRASSPQQQAGVRSPGVSMHSFGATFLEVAVDEALGTVRVRRVVGAYGVGTVLNLKTAESQMRGGIVMGIGQALHEETVYDPRTARIMNANLGEYHVPVNADVPNIEIIFLDEKDEYVNPMGSKGLGETSITGVAAAIANAIYHATGKRVRDLPITPDKLL